jgi:Rod binding domain-containing protein
MSGMESINPLGADSARAAMGEAVFARLGRELLAAAENAQGEPAAKSEQAQQLHEAAQNFEAVLLHKLMEEMQNTIPEGGLFDSPAMKQLQSLFWMNLSDVVAEKGGIGLADQVYKDFCQAAGIDPQADRPRLECLR